MNYEETSCEDLLDEMKVTKKDLFLDYLFNDPECNQNTLLACRKAGFKDQDHSKLVRDSKDAILLRAEVELAKGVPKATVKLMGMMDEDGSVPKADIRLKAIESVLDRTGLSKKQDTNIHIESDTPIFFLPAKSEDVLKSQYSND